MSPEFWMGCFRAMYEWQRAWHLAILNDFRMMGDAAKALLDTAANHTAHPQHKMVHTATTNSGRSKVLPTAKPEKWDEGFKLTKFRHDDTGFVQIRSELLKSGKIIGFAIVSTDLSTLQFGNPIDFDALSDEIIANRAPRIIGGCAELCESRS